MKAKLFWCGYFLWVLQLSTGGPLVAASGGSKEEILLQETSEEAILAPLQPRAKVVFKDEVKGHNLLVIAAASGSGITRQRIYVYVKEEGAWQLLAFRRAVSPRITAKITDEGNALTVFSFREAVLLKMFVTGMTLSPGATDRSVSPRPHSQ